ncbi:hypothetical protein [Pinirhizobacter soli]|uniref:hypothetical protein n=1 Tax=Pinirhizobacter soli TaxID=2786953 RepID=UPI002029E0EF|nr:hypothetical protein [Pinirhizobacter soli]
MDYTQLCVLCKIEQASVNSRGDWFDVSCLGCGQFQVSGTAAHLEFPSGLLPRLRCWARAQSDEGAPLEITSEFLDNADAQIPNPSVSDKLEFALASLARNTKLGGQTIFIHSQHYPRLWAYSVDELNYLVHTLHEQGLIHSTDNFAGHACYLTANGWAKVESSLQAGANSDQAFVAMAFSQDMKAIFDQGIAPAVRAAGYRPHRVDSAPHVERIDWKIISDIRASRFVVADVTTHRNGVYFEAGYALGIDRKVIWTVHEDDLANAHFDTRQFVHIQWKTAEDLREQLERVIVGVIGRPHIR